MVKSPGQTPALHEVKKIETPLPVPRRNIKSKMLFPNVFIYFKETVHKFYWGLRACISRPF